MLHLNDERRARVQRERNLNTPGWQRLIAVCEQYLVTPEPYGVGHMQGFALAGHIAGDSRYKQKAIALALLHCSRGYDAVGYGRTGYGHWGGVREIVPAVACVYDWLHADLAVQQLTTMEYWLVNWARLCWPETQPLGMRDDWGRNDPGDNFYAGFTYAAFAAGLALIAHGGAPAGQGQALLDIADRRWHDELMPHKARFEPDGFPLEGSSYGVQAWTNLLLTLDAVRTVDGSDIWPDAPRLINQYLLHATTPDMRRLTLWGDNAIFQGGKGVNLMPLNDYATYPARIAMNHVPQEGSPTSFAWWLLNINPRPPGGWDIGSVTDFVSGRMGMSDALPPHLQLPPGVWEHPGYVADPPSAFRDAGAFVPPSPFHWLAWVPVLFARPELREDGGGHKLPLVSPGNGFAIACQSGSGAFPNESDRTATQLSFICGPSLQAHQDKAQGAVQIYKDGEMLIGAAKLWNSYWTDWRAAENHSTLLLTPNQQPEPVWNDPDAPAGWKAAAASVKITRSVSGERYLYLEGELAGAYAHRGPWHDDPEKRWVNPLNRWTRRILWHRARDLFLFIDEIEQEPWAQQPVIAWQVRDQPGITPMTWNLAVGGYRIYGAAFNSAGPVRSVAVGSSYRVEVPTGSAPVVQAFQITGSTQMPLSNHLYEQNGALGVTFGLGADAVTLAVQMGDSPPPVEKRIYFAQLRDFTDPVRHETEDALVRVVRESVRTMRSSDTLRVKSYLEDVAPQPQGEFVLIGRS